MTVGQIWLVSGCSTGFGRALVQALLKQSYRVIATARKLNSIQDLEEAGAAILELDVTASPENLVDFARQAVDVYGQVDVLVSNAGYCQAGALEENTHQENVAQFATNFFGVINLTTAFLPYFRKQRDGTIVNISSMGGVLNNPGAGIYCASKAALDSISDTWSRELKPFGIRCVSIQPGAFATAVGSSGNLKVASNRIEGYDSAHDWIKMFDSLSGNEPGDTSKGVLRIIELVKQKELPMRFALGDDGHKLVVQSHEAILRDFRDWKDLSTGTNRDSWGGQ